MNMWKNDPMNDNIIKHILQPYWKKKNGSSQIIKDHFTQAQKETSEAVLAMEDGEGKPFIRTSGITQRPSGTLSLGVKIFETTKFRFMKQNIDLGQEAKRG